MDAPTAARRLNGDEGLASAQFVVAAGLALVTLVMLMQVIAYQYVTGAVTLALERGVRSGSVAGGAVADCEAAIADSLDEVLGGRVGESLSVRCEADATAVMARATGMVPAWTVAGPDLSFDLEAHATRERSP